MHEPVSGNLVYPKFLAAVQGQSMPDVAEAYTYHPLQFAALDQMEPMDDIMEEWKQSGRYDEVTNKYAIEKNFWNGHYWAVAYNIDIRPVYYRRDLLEAKGIAPPKTWDEFQAAALALHDPANEVYGVVYPAGDFHIAQHFYMAFMFQAGGGILDKDGKLIFGTEARDANIKALTYMTDFATKHKVMPEGIASYNTEDAHTVFLQGRAAFGFGTGGLIGRIMRENPDMFDKVGILEVLEGPAGPERKLAAGFFQGFFVWKYSPNIDAAKTFIRWMTEPNRLDPIYKASPGTHWPIYKSGIEFGSREDQPAAPRGARQRRALHDRLRLSEHGRPRDGHHRRRKALRRARQPGGRRRQDAGAGCRRRGRGDAAGVRGIAADEKAVSGARQSPDLPAGRRETNEIQVDVLMLKQQRARFAYYLILPSVILITLLNVVPLIQGILVSLQRQNMVRPNPTSFVGFRHYHRALFEDEIFWSSLGRTIVWTAGSVAGGYVVALALALLLNREMHGRGVLPRAASGPVGHSRCRHGADLEVALRGPISASSISCSSPPVSSTGRSSGLPTRGWRWSR